LFGEQLHLQQAIGWKMALAITRPTRNAQRPSSQSDGLARHDTPSRIIIQTDNFRPIY
jgi:hypothetical protein